MLRPSRPKAPSFIVRVSPKAKRTEKRSLGYTTLRRRLPDADWPCRYSLSYPGKLDEPGQTRGPKTVLYFLHGWMSNDRSWFDRRPTRAIRDHWRRRGVEEPVVASISYGRAWIFGVPALREHFLRQVVPRVESEVHARTGAPVERRLLFGVSMGGINAAYLALNEPDFADRVVAASPAFHDLTPWSGPAEIHRYARSSRAFTPAVGVATGFCRFKMGPQFASRAEFDLEGDIFALAQRNLGPATPPLLITSGQRDLFGFDQGAGKLTQLAEDHGATVRLVRMPKAGHAWIPTQPVADFLLPPGTHRA